MTARSRWSAFLAMLVLLGCGATASNPVPPVESDAIPSLVIGSVPGPGRYAMTLGPLRIALSLPAGWKAWKFGVFPEQEGAEPPTGRGLSFWLVDNIYADPCRWEEGVLDPPPGSSADDLAAALAEQRGRYATAPTTATLSGRAAVEMELTVPPDLRFSSCSRERGHAYVISWPQRYPPGGSRYHQGPGQHDHLWILDIDGDRLVVDASFFPATSESDRSELFEMAESVEVSSVPQ